MEIRVSYASLFCLLGGSFIRRALVSQVTFTCSKSQIAIVEKGVKYVDIDLVFLLLTLNIFRTISSVSIGDFEQVNVSEVTSKLPHAAANVVNIPDRCNVVIDIE